MLTGRLVWENVLTGEVRGRPLEDLDFHLQSPLVPAQLDELLFLLARQLSSAAVIVDVGLGHPVPQTRLGDAQLLRQLRDGLGLLAGKLDGTTTELGRVGSRHGDILPGGRSHLRSGVRATGGSSAHSSRLVTDDSNFRTSSPLT